MIDWLLEQQIERGKEILAHERRKREQGITDDDSLPTASPVSNFFFMFL